MQSGILSQASGSNNADRELRWRGWNTGAPQPEAMEQAQEDAQKEAQEEAIECGRRPRRRRRRSDLAHDGGVGELEAVSTLLKNLILNGLDSRYRGRDRFQGSYADRSDLTA